MKAVPVPQEIVNDESVLLLDWLVAEGALVSEGDAVARIETSKATTDVVAPAGGHVHLLHKPGAEVKVGATLFQLSDSPEEAKSDVPPEFPSNEKTTAVPTRFSKKARDLLAVHGISEEKFKDCGLVRERDVLSVAGLIEETNHQAAEPQPPPETGTLQPAGETSERIEALPRRKRMEVGYLDGGQNALASLVTVNCSTRGLKNAAQNHNELRGNPLPLLIHEVARLLGKYPLFNSWYDAGTIHYYQEVNVGFAVDAGFGLKVPVIRHADQKTIGEIRREIEDLVAAYVADELSPKSLDGGTFTISDLSAEGVHSFSPLINRWQAAILGMGAEFFPPNSAEGAFGLHLAFDHRLAEGRVAAAFLRDLRDRLASYERVLRARGGTPDGSGDLCCARCLRSVDELRSIKVPLLQEVRSEREVRPICLNCMLGY